MSERQKIEDRLRKKQAEVATMEDKLRTAKVYVAALQDVIKMLGDPVDDSSDSGETKLRAGSSVAQARDIILERGDPMHLDDLLEAMGKDVTAAAKASLNGSLAAYARREEIFIRTAPNTYGLIELGHEEEPDEVERPPSGFGRTPVAVIPFDDDDVPF